MRRPSPGAPGRRTTITDGEWGRLFLHPDGRTETFTYDSATGLRRKKETPEAGRIFVWQGQNVLVETDLDLVVQAEYTDLPGMWGGLVSQRRGEVSSFFGFDLQSSARLLVNVAGQVMDTETYKAFGERLASTGTTEHPFRYVGELGYQWDEDDRYYVRARVPDVGKGRWLSRDPIGIAGGVNLYAYVGNNPVRRTDPAGLGYIDDEGVVQHGSIPPGLTSGRLDHAGPSAADANGDVTVVYQFVGSSRGTGTVADVDYEGPASGRETLQERWRQNQRFVPRPPTLDDIQDALDLVGLVPGIGDVADALNAAIYLGRRKYKQAFVCAICLVPAVGELGAAPKLKGVLVVGETMERIKRWAHAHRVRWWQAWEIRGIQHAPRWDAAQEALSRARNLRRIQAAMRRKEIIVHLGWDAERKVSRGRGEGYVNELRWLQGYVYQMDAKTFEGLYAQWGHLGNDEFVQRLRDYCRRQPWGGVGKAPPLARD